MASGPVLLSSSLAPPIGDGNTPHCAANRGSCLRAALYSLSEAFRKSIVSTGQRMNGCRRRAFPLPETDTDMTKRFHVLMYLLTFWALSTAITSAQSSKETSHKEPRNQVLEWNQVFIDTLIATNTPNSSSQRLGAIVHTAIFDAYNGIDRRYTPVFVHESAPRGSSRRAAVIAAAFTALVKLFPTRESQLTEKYNTSLAALRGRDGSRSQTRGIEWGTHVAETVLAWRENDGFSIPQPAFFGGTAVGQWRMTSNCNQLVGMTAQALAFTDMFVLDTNRQFQPPPPRIIPGDTYASDFNTVKALGRATGSSRTADQTALGPFWEGNASVH